MNLVKAVILTNRLRLVMKTAKVVTGTIGDNHRRMDYRMWQDNRRGITVCLPANPEGIFNTFFMRVCSIFLLTSLIHYREILQGRKDNKKKTGIPALHQATDENQYRSKQVCLPRSIAF